MAFIVSMMVSNATRRGREKSSCGPDTHFTVQQSQIGKVQAHTVVRSIEDMFILSQSAVWIENVLASEWATPAVNV